MAHSKETKNQEKITSEMTDDRHTKGCINSCYKSSENQRKYEESQKTMYVWIDRQDSPTIEVLELGSTTGNGKMPREIQSRFKQK